MAGEHWMIVMFLVGLACGVLAGWFTWRLPMIFAEQRGQELDADGLTICSKEIAAAGVAALLPDNAGDKPPQVGLD